MVTSEQQQIEELRSGSETVWRTFIDQYKNRVYKTALSFVPFADDAEDISQEVFIEVHRSINRFREDSTLSTWIYRITVNKALNYIKRNKNHFSTRSFDDYNGTELSEIPGTDADESAKNLIQKEQQQIIHQALNKLPERQRTVFVMHKMDGLSYKSISEVLEISLSSVESLMHRAKLSLQHYLTELYMQNKK